MTNFMCVTPFSLVVLRRHGLLHWWKWQWQVLGDGQSSRAYWSVLELAHGIGYGVREIPQGSDRSWWSSGSDVSGKTIARRPRMFLGAW